MFSFEFTKVFFPVSFAGNKMQRQKNLFLKQLHAKVLKIHGVGKSPKRDITEATPGHTNGISPVRTTHPSTDSTRPLVSDEGILSDVGSPGSDTREQTRTSSFIGMPDGGDVSDGDVFVSGPGLVTGEGREDALFSLDSGIHGSPTSA